MGTEAPRRGRGVGGVEKRGDTTKWWCALCPIPQRGRESVRAWEEGSPRGWFRWRGRKAGRRDDARGNPERRRDLRHACLADKGRWKKKDPQEERWEGGATGTEEKGWAEGEKRAFLFLIVCSHTHPKKKKKPNLSSLTWPSPFPRYRADLVHQILVAETHSLEASLRHHSRGWRLGPRFVCFHRPDPPGDQAKPRRATDAARVRRVAAERERTRPRKHSPSRPASAHHPRRHRAAPRALPGGVLSGPRSPSGGHWRRS